MRDIYKSRHKEILELKQARNKDLFVDFVYKLSKQINQRFYRIEKAGVGLTESAYKYAQYETGKDKPRYSTNKKKLHEMTLEELYNLSLKLNNKVVSKTSTIPGIKEVNKKRVEMSLLSLNKEIGSELTEEEKSKWNYFLMMGGSELMNNKFLDSFQIREDWYNYTYKGGVSVKEFLEVYRNFINDSRVDYGKIKRTLKNLGGSK